MPTVIPFAEAESDFEKLLNSVVIRDSVAIIVRQDALDAVVMSIDTYNSIMETAYLLKSPADARCLAHSIKQLQEYDAK